MPDYQKAFVFRAHRSAATSSAARPGAGRRPAGGIAGDGVGGPRLWIDPGELGSLDQAVNSSGAMAALVRVRDNQFF